MSDLDRLKKFVKWFNELIFGTPAKYDKCCGGGCKPKRARDVKGRYKGDDPTTKDYNEAYVGGKAPTRKQLLGLKKKRRKK